MLVDVTAVPRCFFLFVFMSGVALIPIFTFISVYYCLYAFMPLLLHARYVSELLHFVLLLFAQNCCVLRETSTHPASRMPTLCS
jgi:hypothetical protein